MAEETVTISREEYESLKQENVKLAQTLNELQERLRLAGKQRFGRSSEQSKYDDGSEPLGMELVVNETGFLSDVTAGLEAKEPDLTTIHEYKRKKHATNPEKLPEDVEIEIVNLDLSDEEKVCPQCGSEMRKIGEEVLRRLKIVPAKVVIVETHKATYACENCEKNDIATPVKTAGTGLPGFLPGCMCTPEAVAYIMTQKFVMYSPLYRLEQEFSRMKAPFSRQTMSAWLTKATTRYLRPVYDLLKQKLLQEDVLHADETTLQVLREPGRTPQQKSYIWLYRTGREAAAQSVL